MWMNDDYCVVWEIVRFSVCSSTRTLRKWLSVPCCIVLDVMIPWPTILKRKWVLWKTKRAFGISWVPRLHCASPHILWFCETGYATVLGYGPWVLYHSFLRLCANVFGVGPESDGEALTDHWSRPWGLDAPVCAYPWWPVLIPPGWIPTCETGRPRQCDLMTSLSESSLTDAHCVDCLSMHS